MEILVVVIILGIIAAIVLPKFSNASATARASMLADDLRVIRTQIMVFKAQHNGVPPGHPNCDTGVTPDSDTFVVQMTTATDTGGSTTATNRPYGPYLREMPTNPVNDKKTVRFVADGAAMTAADSDGWIYQPSATTFKADCPGADDTGKAYIDY